MAKKQDYSINTGKLSFDKKDVLADYRIAYLSRQASLLGRKEVLSGKAKFGIFGDGKEVAQLALAKAFKPGDWRAGYYRDQTILMALGILSVREFFAQLYADADVKREPASAGRQMNNHFASRYIDDNGEWLNQKESYNISADLSPTGGQMARLLGLAYASKLYRHLPDLKKQLKKFSHNGDEIAFGTIGNASTSEGIFFETINAACVLKVPILMSVWDDDYGISVPQKYHTTKESISEALAGFRLGSDGKTGLDIYVVKGWDYAALCEVYQQAAEKVRRDHTPALVHVVEMTQPQGHSTSGSHERYKSSERLAYEEQIDCIHQMRQWIIKSNLANASELEELEKSALSFVKDEMRSAWQSCQAPVLDKKSELLQTLEDLKNHPELSSSIEEAINQLENMPQVSKKSLLSHASRLLLNLKKIDGDEIPTLTENLHIFIEQFKEQEKQIYNTHLFNEKGPSPLNVSAIEASYHDDDSKNTWVDGRQIINDYFHKLFKKDPRIFAMGEDIGQLGGVNLEFENIQKSFGELRCSDTGIREATIFGQGLGAAMRGLRPIVDIQYLDYLLYCLQPMSDDLASLHYRTSGGQAAPVIIRTKGHRLEGIWHTGSPMGMIINSVRGIHVCVPRNFVQAAGMYETLINGDDPALVIEVLNGYRVKEKMPLNLGEYRVALGVPEILSEGSDITLVTYGACIRVAEDALAFLRDLEISVELIDVQTLLPFDRHQMILESIKKTNAVIFLDEDVSGGASAFMMQQVLEGQGAYDYIDAAPICLAAKDHRSAYASDGDYFSKPNAEDIIEACISIMHDRFPQRFARFGKNNA